MQTIAIIKIIFSILKMRDYRIIYVELLSRIIFTPITKTILEIWIIRRIWNIIVLWKDAVISI